MGRSPYRGCESENTSMKITRVHDETTVELTWWDDLVQWFHHAFGRCDAWCSKCYDQATVPKKVVGQFWKYKKEGDPDPCVCRDGRTRHIQLYPDDPGPRGACQDCDCQEFELPMHDNVYESPLTAGTYKTFDYKTQRLADRPITWQHDRKRCRVCNGTVNTVGGL